MTTLALQYGTLTTITITVASLPSDASLSSGRCSTPIDNTTNEFVDYIFCGFVSLGGSVTVEAKQIQLWLGGSNDGSHFTAGLATVDANDNVCGQKTLLKLVEVIPTTSTVSGTYNFGPYSVANTFRGVVPNYWSVFIAQSTCQILHSLSGAHELCYTPLYYQSS